MRLYLSSYMLGNCPPALAELFGENRHAAVIANALDPYLTPTESREVRVASQANALAELGCTSEELDLRDYFGRGEALAEKLSGFGLVWVHGGNSFVLKRAFEQSGCDRILADMLKRDAIVYGGFSAALMMVMPTMRGIELCDDIETVPEGYKPEFSWDGLGLIPYSIVPHYRSDHPESAMMEDVVAYLVERRMPYRTLRDGEAIVVDGTSERTVGNALSGHER
jgi:dipeptidase E